MKHKTAIIIGMLVLGLGIISCTQPAGGDTGDGVGSGCVVTQVFNYTGAPTPVKTTLEQGAVFPEPAMPVRSGYDFVGWYKLSYSNEYDYEWVYDFNEPVTQDTTLYCRWEPHIAVITLGAGTPENYYTSDFFNQIIFGSVDEDTYFNRTYELNGYTIRLYYYNCTTGSTPKTTSYMSITYDGSVIVTSMGADYTFTDSLTVNAGQVVFSKENNLLKLAPEYTQDNSLESGIYGQNVEEENYFNGTGGASDVDNKIAFLSQGYGQILIKSYNSAGLVIEAPAGYKIPSGFYQYIPF